MADDAARGVTDEARASLDESVRSLKRMLKTIERVMERMERKDDPSAPEVSKVISALTQVQTELRKKVEAYERDTLREAGALEDARIDFDTLRAEIGRKLDRLREPVEDNRVDGESDE